MTGSTWIALASGAALLTACSVRDDKAAQPAATDAPGDTGVAREEIPSPTPSATPAPVPAAAIQTQPGPNGATVSLNRANVTGDVLTVALSYSGGTCCPTTMVDDVSVIDDATSQRLSILKDNGGKAMAAPVIMSGKDAQLNIRDSVKAPVQVWFKFPAPPATTKTVSINIPNVAPFDAVPVTR